MEETKPKRKKIERTIYIVIIVLLVIALVLGTTYAYFQVQGKQDDDNLAGTGCFDVTFTEQDDIVTYYNYPVSDKQGMETPAYTFTLSNICDYTAYYQINAEILNDNEINPSYMKANLNDETGFFIASQPEVTPTEATATKAYKIAFESLAPGQSITYDYRQWIDANTPMTEQNLKYRTKITIITSAMSTPSTFCAKNGTTALAECSVAGNNSYDAKPTYTGEDPSGVYKVTDDTGTSSIFIGKSEELYNNLVFAGYQWKIVRIEGDGNIKLIYNGECPNNSCVINARGEETSIGYYFYYPSNIKPDYVKYKNGVQDSKAKEVLEDWYSKNIYDYGYDDMVADTIYCNDTTVGKNRYGNDVYGANARIDENKPSLICSQDIDKYTVSSDLGNGILNYKVGLLTADEAYIASAKYGSDGYLFSNINYWLLSPSYIRDDYYHGILANNFYYRSYNDEIDSHFLSTNYFIRPSISLKSTVEVVSGNGSKETPFVVGDPSRNTDYYKPNTEGEANYDIAGGYGYREEFGY